MKLRSGERNCKTYSITALRKLQGLKQSPVEFPVGLPPSYSSSLSCNCQHLLAIPIHCTQYCLWGKQVIAELNGVCSPSSHTGTKSSFDFQQCPVQESGDGIGRRTSSNDLEKAGQGRSWKLSRVSPQDGVGKGC